MKMDPFSNDKSESSQVSNFFSNKILFITGVTGYCGRIFLLKILKQLDSVDKIYVMLRQKRCESPRKRIDDLLSTQVFSFGPISSSQRSKIIPVEGDLSDPNLIASNMIANELMESVDHVFHIAASVKFDANFRTHFKTNVEGTENVINFANKMKKLKSFLHVSTAYSNCHLKRIDEKLYPLSDDVEKLIAKIRSVDDETLDKMQLELFQTRPNSYVYTKALAEQLLDRNRGKYHVIILRPAIVSPAVNDPAPGYVDSFNGPAGFSTVSALGIAKITDWSFNHQVDFYPVDFVANACLGSTWLACKRKSTEDLTIINLCSSSFRNEDSYEMLVKGEKVMRKSPSLFVIRPPTVPPKEHNMSKLEYKVKIFYAHIMFAFLIDSILFILRQKPIMRRVVARMHYAFDLMKYFADRSWEFETNGLINLINSLKGKDREIFNVDVGNIDSDYAVSKVWLGVRKYLLRESEKTIPIARIKYKIQVVIYFLYQLTILYLTFKLFTYWSMAGILPFLLFGYLCDHFNEIVNCGNLLIDFM